MDLVEVGQLFVVSTFLFEVAVRRVAVVQWRRHCQSELVLRHRSFQFQQPFPAQRIGTKVPAVKLSWIRLATFFPKSGTSRVGFILK